MKFPPASLITLIRLFRRDGVSFFAKCARYAFSKDAWRWLLRGGAAASRPGRGARPALQPADIELVRRSELFDADWYLRENPDVAQHGLDPAKHYLMDGRRTFRNPSPDFVGEEYLALNQDVAAFNTNPLVHFERNGRKEGRFVSFLQVPPNKPFPTEAIECEQTFCVEPIRRRNRRIAVFAAFSADGLIPETTLLYLRGLKEVVDGIVFVANNPLVDGQIEKLRDLVRQAVFKHHGGYDFKSYAIGIDVARKTGLLDANTTDELVLANDSCYAPVFPFASCFETMSKRKCDFWGMTQNRGFVHGDHVQSYFLVFRRSVLDGAAFWNFFDSMESSGNRWDVIRKCEAGLSRALVDAGYSFDTLAPANFAAAHGAMPTKFPLELMRGCGMPLVKAKALAGDMLDDRTETMNFIRKQNSVLAAVIPPPPTPPELEPIRVARNNHQASFTKKIEELERRACGGQPIRAAFLVSSVSMFPARPLFDAMRSDRTFNAYILVIPDLRWGENGAGSALSLVEKELLASYPRECVCVAKKSPSGEWADELSNADIVCYPSPYDLSTFRYNPHWAVGRSFLPIHVNYGFYRSVYDRDVVARQNYAYFWKAFFECEATVKEYAEHSILKGANAEVVGYVKMDALATATPWPRNGNRKRVLIAPHHSVEGGANDTLALSNFQRYADYFLALPEKHPELDFVFRPHPFLFTVLARKNKWGPEKVEDWIARMKAQPNVRWSDDGDYFPAFASCDACVQDCGSYLVEWFYTGKPCCYMLKSPADIDAKFAPLGKECLSHCYVAYDEAAIEAFLRDVVESGNDPKSTARDEFRKKIMVNYPHAADAALQSIRKALGIPTGK